MLIMYVVISITSKTLEGRHEIREHLSPPSKANKPKPKSTKTGE